MQINKEDLQKIISDTASAAGAQVKGSLPILDYLLIKGKGGILSSTASSNELESTSAISCDCEDFEMLLPAKKINDILKTVDAATIKIDKGEGDKLKIKAGRSRFTVVTDSVDDFPFIERFNPTCEFDIDGGELKQKIQSVQYAMANQDVRYYLNGMLIDGDGETITLVATDGHRLAKTELSVPGVDGSWILPREAVSELVKLIDGPTNIELSDNKLKITSGRVSMIAKLIDGKFPDWRRVVPELSPVGFNVNPKDLRASINRVVILSNQKYRSIRMQIESGELKLQARNTESEESSEDFDIDYSDDPIEIGVNGVYFAESLGLCADTASINLKDGNSAMRIDDGQSTHVVMPMRL